MRLYVTSDLHADIWTPYAIPVTDPRLKSRDMREDVIRESMAHIWEFRGHVVGGVDGIVVAGDIGNDFRTDIYAIRWLSEHYGRVYLVMGNHDMLVRGDYSWYNRVDKAFADSADKVAHIREFCLDYPNVEFLDGNLSRDGKVGGCMGMCDMKCYRMARSDRAMLTQWRKWLDGKHWRIPKRDPIALWSAESDKMRNIASQGPGMMVTHFVPAEIGYERGSLDYGSAMFYFSASPIMELFPRDAVWACGHIHTALMGEYVNRAGHTVRILNNPNGYPGDGNPDIMCTRFKEGRLEFVEYRPYRPEDFIIEV